MTNEEALKCIDRIINDNGIYGTSPLAPHAIEALQTAISALERQIPRKPFKESLADRLCTVCGAYINFDALNDDIESAPLFCTNCGQALYWSKNDDE